VDELLGHLNITDIWPWSSLDGRLFRIPVAKRAVFCCRYNSSLINSCCRNSSRRQLDSVRISGHVRVKQMKIFRWLQT
jgi:hypothetical protein